MQVSHIVRMRVPLEDLVQIARTDDKLLLEGRKWVFESANVYNSFIEDLESYVELELKEVVDAV